MNKPGSLITNGDIQSHQRRAHMNKLLLQKTGILLLSLIFIFLNSIHGKESFHLEEIMSSSFPSHLKLSPKGDLVAWVFNSKGKRNIWIAQGPDYKAKRLTSYHQDDGQEIGDLEFNRDGSILVYVKGGSANRKGENPNPTSDPKEKEQAVWAVHIQEGNLWKIGKGSSPLCSPSSNQVVFQNHGNIFLSDVRPDAQPRILFKARGQNSAQQWSPDGTKMAFVSYREDHSFIGIFDLTEQSIKWISPSVERDAYPVWSPCGNYIAFIRFIEGVRSSFRGGIKYQIMVADVATQEAKTVWECPNATGGFAQYYPSEPLRWAHDSHLVFYSEHDKWMHLYSFSLEDDNLISLTPGNYEVEDSFLTSDGKKLIYNSNQDDMDRRHLWSVPVSGGEAKRLTAGDGIEWSPVLTSESKDLIFLCSTAVQPAAPAFKKMSQGETNLMAPQEIPADFPSEKLVKPQQVILHSPDGYTIHCQLFVPKDSKPGDSRPAVIFMHGGPIRQMLLGWHMRGYYHNAYAMNQYLTGKGYVVLSVNYRSGIGYGYEFRNAPKQGPRGASEYQDIVAAGLYLQRRDDVDPGKVGLWGGSYGGYLTAMGLARDSDLFAAGVDLHGVHDWSLRGRRRNGGGWDIYGDDLMNHAFQSSPVADVEFWFSPVLFVHGDDDRNVDFIQTTDLVHRLKRLGIAHVETLIIPDEVHGFLCHKNWIQVYRSAADFFDRFLLNKTQ
ncbi:MAG: prolyl oligopeptidase family serine peptidase [Candidatus Aminicenantes bacterium]|nr:prolyl oligopeptidase family serine peptidase [Candidatus Aminicenantes bacterium]